MGGAPHVLRISHLSHKKLFPELFLRLRKLISVKYLINFKQKLLLE